MSALFLKRIGQVCLAGLLSLALAALAWAQNNVAGAIVGTVTDSSGAVVPGAKAVGVNVATNFRESATTDANGRYVLDNLPPGTYTVTIEAAGFSTYKRENLTIEVGLSTPVDATLRVAAQVTTVIATATAPVVTTDRPDFSTNINAADIANIPINGRRWSYFKLANPAATADGGFGLVSFRGISGLLNNNSVDGGDNNQAFFSEEKGRTRISYSVSEASIQEYQVNASNYSAEYGRSAGGVINAVTKSGTNTFHGEAFEYFRDSDFSAINPFAVQTVIVNGKNTVTHINPEDKLHQFGGTLGGSILKNRLFYFFSADQQLRKFPAVGVPGNPAAFFSPLSALELGTLASRGISAAQANAGLLFLQGVTGTVPRTGDELVMLPKIDWQINPSNHASVEYNRMRWASPGGIQTGAVVTRGIDSFGDDFVKDDTMIARLTSSFGPSITNQALFEYGRDFEFESNSVVLPGEPVAATTGFSPQIGVSGGGGITFGMPNFLQRPAFPDEHRYQWTDTVSLSHGTHLFKFGADINRVNDLDRNLFEGFGAYSYNNRVDFISDYTAAAGHFASPVCGSGANKAGCYNNFFQGFGPLGFGFTTWDTGLFVNDEWRVKPRVTLNLGLRYDLEKLPGAQIPNSLLAQTSQLPSDPDGLGPRLGLAWDLTGKGTTVIRGGYGIFYGRIINANIFNAIAETGNPAGQLTFQFRPGPNSPRYPNTAAAPPAGALNPPNIVVVGKGLQAPLIHEFDVVLEHQIAASTAVSISYVGSIGRDLPNYIDANLPPPAGSITYTVSGGVYSGQQFTMPLFTGARPNPNFAAITNIEGIVHSHYNAMVLEFNRRMSAGLQLEATYTYSNAQDNGQSSNTGTPILNVFNPYDIGLEQGTSNFNTPQRFSALMVWQPAYYQGSRLGKMLLNGFSVAPIVSAASGAPVTGTVAGSAPLGLGTISSGINGSGTGFATNRPPWIPRNDFRMPRSVDVDMEVAKSVPFSERFNLKLFVQAFNLFNHVNATAVDTQLYTAGGTKTAPALTYNPDFLHVTASSNSLIAQRQIQIGGKFTW